MHKQYKTIQSSWWQWLGMLYLIWSELPDKTFFVMTMMTNENDEEKRKVIDWIGRHRMTSTSDKQTNMRQQSGLKQETGKIFICRAIYENKKIEEILCI